MSKLPETLTEAEFLRVLKVTRKTHHKLAFMLGYYQGMRVGEIVGLQPENVDHGQRIIRIKQGKGGKDRNIPIMPEVARYLKHLPIKCGVRALEIKFKKALADAGITRELHFHNLRHSSATRLLGEKGWNIRQVQQFLGHSRLDTTMIYTIVKPEDLVKLAWEGVK